MKNLMIGIGTVLTAGALLTVTGCKQTEVLKNEKYVPAAAADQEMSAPAGMPAYTDAVVTEPAPAATTAPAPAKEYPRFSKKFSSAPISGAKASSKTSSAKTVKAGGTYVVKAGDSCSAIAVAHKVRLADLLAANNLTMAKANRLRIGQKLIIPAGGVAVKTAAKSAATGSAKSAAPELVDGFYVVKAGDNIPKIAKRLGVKRSELMAANNLDEAATRRLQIGQKLAVPGKSAAAAAAPAAATPAPAATPAVDDTALDNKLNSLPEVGAPVTTDAPVTTVDPAAPVTSDAPVTTVDAADPAAAAAPAVKEDEYRESLTDTIPKGTRLGDYLKSRNLTLDEFKRDNQSAMASFQKNGEDELDSIATESTYVFIPAQK
ncbi:MAG: LysM peptidoglycan-binding domain-containing protein [Lentisphaeria bacterium]|nr:LysM peptidoglycan-binding domain-containing protein [Lentisphaeria bacterium]